MMKILAKDMMVIHAKEPRPLAWRSMVLIVTTFSALVWIAILFAVISLLNSL
jgi:hypothetical protein